MQPKGAVYYNTILAGYIEKKSSRAYVFTYTDDYFADKMMPSISLTLPKSVKEHHDTVLFPFFSGLLSEGINKDIQCKALKIDEDDDFTRLLKTAGDDTIGAITVKEIQN